MRYCVIVVSSFLTTGLIGMDLRMLAVRLGEPQALRYVREYVSDSAGKDVRDNCCKLTSGVTILPYLDFILDYRIAKNYLDGATIRFPYFEIGYRYSHKQPSVNSALFIPLTHTIISGEWSSLPDEKTTWFNLALQEVLWSKSEQSLASVFFVEAEWKAWVHGNVDKNATLIHDNVVVACGFDYPALGFLCGLKAGMSMYMRESEGDMVFVYRPLWKLRLFSPPVKNLVRLYGDWGIEKLLHHNNKSWSVGISLCPEVLNWRRK